ETQRHDGGGRVCGARPGEDRHLAIRVHARGMIASGQRINLVEMISFDPILEFTGLVAGILSDFEHGDDNHSDCYWLWSSADGRSKGEKHGGTGSCGEAESRGHG